MVQLHTVRAAARPDPLALTCAGWVVGLSCTVLTVASRDVLPGYHSPELHLVLNSVDACVALLLAYLLVGRFRRSHRLQHLLLGEALLLLALAGIGSAVVADLLEESARRSVGAWWPLSVRLVAAVLVLAAAVAGERRTRAHWTGPGVAVPGVVVAAALAAVWASRDRLPAVTTAAPAGSDAATIDGHPVLVLAQMAAAGCFLVASVAFAVQARRGNDEVLRWLGPACALAGFARVSYIVVPSLYSDWLFVGDLLRMGCYLCLLVGATREIARYWSAYTQVALLEDRRRLARELHDGVVQELGLIKAEVRGLADDAERPRAAGAVPIVEACDRALDEARAAVEAWGRDADEPLGYVVHRAARQVADRHGARVVVDVDDGVDAGTRQRHDLARITREAVGNAIRHGAADCVRVTLEHTPEGRRLVVRDDGRGFDPAAAARGTGYGLTSMRERARGLPGSLELHSEPGAGTTVVVTW